MHTYVSTWIRLHLFNSTSTCIRYMLTSIHSIPIFLLLFLIWYSLFGQWETWLLLSLIHLLILSTIYVNTLPSLSPPSSQSEYALPPAPCWANPPRGSFLGSDCPHQATLAPSAPAPSHERLRWSASPKNFMSYVWEVRGQRVRKNPSVFKIL